MMKSLLFGEILNRDFSISNKELDKALKFQEEYNGKIGEILLNSGVISEDQITSVLSSQSEIEELSSMFKNHSDYTFEPLLDISPVWFVRNEIIPLKLVEKEIYFAIKDPLNLFPIEIMNGTFSQFEITFLIADERQFREIINLFNHKYLKTEETVFNKNEIEKLKDLAAEAPIIKFVNSMISRASEYRASDIHLESHSDYLKIRYRIDGVLKDMDKILSSTASAVISRTKIMADIDIGEKRLPQDGRIQIKVAGKNYDIRVSTLPTIYGENIVMRLLEKENINYDINTLGLKSDEQKQLDSLLANNFGLILVTGPTGSGKSTSLYSILNTLNIEDRKIITVEDPVEYQLEGITQVQVQEQIGLTFASVLRNILRQDPDIIMIGEIRDKETAEIAIRASLTGHLVFATLHTNDAISAITRLIDMGVDDFLVNSSLLGVIAQRLVRKNCISCSKEHFVKDSVLKELEADNHQTINLYKKSNFKIGEGCDICAGTGYKGRIGVFEILDFNDRLKSELMKNREYEHLKNFLRKNKFKTLRDDALLKWVEGMTTLDEVYRVT